MTEVISVKFKSGGKMYYFDPAGNEVRAGERVIVDTANGTELVECVEGNHEVEDNQVVQPLRPVLRHATEADERYMQDNPRREAEAFKICEKKIAEFKLDMKLVRVEYNFDGSKIIFFFTSDGRVDFRELVKELAGIFKTRIILRQIGVRDEAKMIGGLGICGKPFCCATFLDDFQPVSIKMAKTQSLSLNPTKISGACGRLMCCLKYEQDAYEDAVKRAPKNGSAVTVDGVQGTVTDVNLLRETVKVRVEGQTDDKLMTFKDGDLRPVEEKKENDNDLLLRYFSRFESDEKQERESQKKETEGGKNESRRRRNNHNKSKTETPKAEPAEQSSEQQSHKKSRNHRRGSGRSSAASAEGSSVSVKNAAEPAKNTQTQKKNNNNNRAQSAKAQNQSKNSGAAAQRSTKPAEPAAKSAAAESGSGAQKKRRHRYYRPKKNSGGSGE